MNDGSWLLAAGVKLSTKQKLHFTSEDIVHTADTNQNISNRRIKRLSQIIYSGDSNIQNNDDDDNNDNKLT